MKQAINLLLALTITLCAAAQAYPGSFWMGKTTGRFPYMEYGLGDDRLGGAKMGYIDTNVVMKVVDSVNTDYRVQLSRFHFAYMPKTAVKRDSTLQAKPYILSENFRVYGDDDYDYVKINLEQKLPYKAIQEIHPSRLLVDIYGATSNTNWITQLKTAKEIRNVYYEQKEDDVLRVTIELQHQQHWGHHIYYDSTGSRLIIRIKRQPDITSIRNLRIAIDAGHGGDNDGADGVTSHVLEKNYTLLIAKQLEKTLKAAGVKHTFMTRRDDTTLTMPERTEMLLQEAPDLLISIHLNSAGNDSVSGTSTYYRYIGFRPLSTAILKQMLALGLNEYGNVGNFNFALSGPTEYPNALVEVAFLSNRADEKKILSPAFHKKVATQILKGIQNWIAGMK
ncbi:N-acetylmuramoyl-L-alanine amidase [Deminuibacter soli]|uniref:N-acetylmuramoyl-L-alanine amidase n=1 Tax=Deminuibacter soli TaxID=2291815 RepID=A0A3E1NRE7_9BACT|nr:N-acetylmuramoyl-L-alanine amidase [Deminuibacter soli]RFM30394.1 N-acetylmuramoyl-L-alanine amidase [Deminuibacter soli]